MLHQKPKKKTTYPLLLVSAIAKQRASAWERFLFIMWRQNGQCHHSRSAVSANI